MGFKEGIKCDKCGYVDYSPYPYRICPKCGTVLGAYKIINRQKMFIISDYASIVVGKKILFWNKIVSERK